MHKGAWNSMHTRAIQAQGFLPLTVPLSLLGDSTLQPHNVGAHAAQEMEGDMSEDTL